MFFDFSFQKVSRLTLILGGLLGATFIFVVTHPNFTITYAGELTKSYFNSNESNFSYVLGHKLFTEGGSGDKPPSNLVASITSAYQNLLALINPNKSTTVFADSGTARSIPVLLYHGESEASQTLPLNTFIEQMHALKDAGWNTISMEDFYAFIREGKPVPDKSFLLTFDDGRKDSYYPADPVLADVGFKAVMFVITGFSLPDNTNKKSSFYLSKTELQLMQDSGRWELESHGKEDHYYYNIDQKNTEGHFLSNKLWLPDQKRLETDDEFKARVSEDQTKSKNALQNAFGKPVIAFAYPFSDYGQDTQNFQGSEAILDQIVPSTYKLTFYQVSPGDGDTFNYPSASEYKMKRLEPLPSWSGAHLLQILETGRAKDIPYQSTAFDRDWVGTWGKVIASSTLKLMATSDTSGAAASLNGSGAWKDYSFTADASMNTGGSIMLAARYNNSKNFVLCSFSSDRVSTREVVDGVAKQGQNIAYKTGQMGTYGISVSGQSVACYVNGNLVVRNDTTDKSLSQGGIGIQTWEEKNGKAYIEVKNVKISQPLL